MKNDHENRHPITFFKKTTKNPHFFKGLIHILLYHCTIVPFAFFIFIATG